MSSPDPDDDARALAFIADERRRRSRNLTIAAVATVAIAGVIAAVVIFGGRRDGDAAAVDGGEAGSGSGSGAREPIAIELARAQLEQDPCGKRPAADLANAYNSEDRFAEAVAWVDDFNQRCGEYRYLLWKKFYALQQLAQWQASVDVATHLIEGVPDDSDYWWWRGESLVELKRLVEASADFRQSIASSDLAASNGVHVMHLARIAKDLGRPCEGAFALGVYREHHGELSSGGDRLHAELSVVGDCEQLVGHGAARIRAKAGQPVYKSTARVGAATGTFLVDPRTPYVTVTRAFADRAGLTTAPPRITTRAGFELRRAELAIASRIELTRASAPNVDVAVVDALPPGVDGVIGQSFLWRFQVEDDGSELVLRER